MRAAIYVRLSEEKEGTTSPTRQRDLCAKYAEVRGWTVVSVYEDINVSASHRGLDRPALARLRAAAAAHEVDVVVCWRLDRLTRSVLDILSLLKEWEEVGVATVSATEGIDLSTPVGRAMATLIAAFAEMEVNAMRERVAQSIDQLRREHRFAGGTVGYGYMTAPNPRGSGRILVVVPEEAERVAEAAGRVIAGEAAYRICRDYNERGIPAPRSPWRRAARMNIEARERAGLDLSTADRGTWRVQSMVRMLTSDHIAGRVTHRGQILTNERGLPAEVYQPLVSEFTLASVRLRLSNRRDEVAPRSKSIGTAEQRLFSGLVYCAVCGAKMYVRRSGGAPIYSCPARSRGETCPSPRVSARALESHVVAETLRVHGGGLVMKLAEPIDEESVGVRYQKIEQKIRKTIASMGDDSADMVALSERLLLLKQARADLRKKPLHKLGCMATGAPGKLWREEFAGASEDDRHRMLRAQVHQIQIAPTASRAPRLDIDRVNINWIQGTKNEAVSHRSNLHE